MRVRRDTQTLGRDLSSLDFTSMIGGACAVWQLLLRWVRRSISVAVGMGIMYPSLPRFPGLVSVLSLAIASQND
jgi:hypothetical protein